MKWQRIRAASVLISGLVLAGCGGTSGTGTQNQNQNLPNRSVDTPPDGNTRAEGQSGRVGIFLSATPNSKVPSQTTHLWVNILKVEVIDVQEKAATVYDSQDGVSVDLNTLYETSGRRFSLLTSASVPSGKAYIRARITFGKAFSVFGADSTTAQFTPLADTVPHDDKENPILSFPLTRPRDLGNGRENLVIDFDLGRMQTTDGRITPALREGDQNGLSDLSRQIPTTFIGTIQELTGSDAEKKAVSTPAGETPRNEGANVKSVKNSAKDTNKVSLPTRKDAEGLPVAPLTPPITPPTPAPATVSETVTKTSETNVPSKSAPSLSGRIFTLSLGTNRSIAIQAGEATVYDNDGAGSNPTLTEGKKAAVRGILDPVTKRILAQRITLLSGDGSSTETTTLRGAVTTIDTKNNLLILATTQTEGLLPSFAAVTVQMVPDAIYRSRGGLLLTGEEFAAALSAQPGIPIAISGVYEPVTGTMRGKTARLEEVVPGTAHEAKITGQAQSVDATSGTFTLSSLTLWQGITSPSEGAGVPIATTVATAYRDEKGQYIASANFYTALKEGRSTQATGLYSGGTLTATRLDLLPAETKTMESKSAETRVDSKTEVKEAKGEAKPVIPSEGKNDVPKPEDKKPEGEKPEDKKPIS